MSIWRDDYFEQKEPIGGRKPIKANVPEPLHYQSRVAAPVATAPNTGSQLVKRLMRLLSLLCLVAGFTLFIISLQLPCLRNAGFNGGGGTWTGIQCLIGGFIFWPSNGLFLLSPLLRWVASLHVVPWFILELAYTLSTILVLSADTRDFLFGAYYWLTAHVLVTLAMWTTLPRKTNLSFPPGFAKSSPQQTD